MPWRAVKIGVLPSAGGREDAVKSCQLIWCDNVDSAHLQFPSGVIFAMHFVMSAAGADFPEVDQLPDVPSLPDPLVMFDGTPVGKHAAGATSVDLN